MNYHIHVDGRGEPQCVEYVRSDLIATAQQEARAAAFKEAIAVCMARGEIIHRGNLIAALQAATELKKDGIRAAMSEQTERGTLKSMAQRGSDTKDEVTLLPCPFCGASAGDVPLSRGHGFIIGCSSCQAQQFATERADAIKAWNSRAAAPVALVGTPEHDLPFEDYCERAGDCRVCAGMNCTCPHHAPQELDCGAPRPDDGSQCAWGFCPRPRDGCSIYCVEHHASKCAATSTTVDGEQDDAEILDDPRVDKELRRWQDAIRDKLIDLGAPDWKIDGAGCDSGDPLDFTLTEIGQGVGYFIDQLEELKKAGQ